jgi:hypothetical protein
MVYALILTTRFNIALFFVLIHQKGSECPRLKYEQVSNPLTSITHKFKIKDRPYLIRIFASVLFTFVDAGTT